MSDQTERKPRVQEDVDLVLLPGFYTEGADNQISSRYKDGDRVRFKNRLPEKMGGWLQSALDAVMVGAARALLPWASNSFEKFLAVGTNTKYYRIAGLSTVTDITPYMKATSDYAGGLTALTNPFAMTSGSAIVTVTHTAHGTTVGSRVWYGNVDAGGGITIDGGYDVTTLVNANTFKITHSSAASSTDASVGGAAVEFGYEVPIGGSQATAGLGYNAGTWNDSTWNTPRTTSAILFDLRTHSLSTWGEDVVINPRNEGLYYYDVSAHPARPQVITNSPAVVGFSYVSPFIQILVACACTTSGAQDKLYMQWCDEADYTDWTATDDNYSADFRFPIGSELLAAIHTERETLVFTDSSVYRQTFIGLPYVFSNFLLDAEIGIIGPNAGISISGVIYFMGRDQFYVYDGTLQTMNCDIWSKVFEDINYEQKSGIACGLNKANNEVWWHYCSEAAQLNDRYAIYNYQEKVWYYGSLNRTAWADTSIYASPYAVCTNGFLWTHEVGFNDGVTAMGEYLETYDFRLSKGQHNMLFRKLIPNFAIDKQTKEPHIVGDLSVYVRGKKYPNSAQVSKGPFTINSTVVKINPRLRARQASLRFEGDTALDGDWRMDSPGIEVRQSGKR